MVFSLKLRVMLNILSDYHWNSAIILGCKRRLRYYVYACDKIFRMPWFWTKILILQKPQYLE